MTVIWPTLKIRPDKPLEATQLEIMRHVDRVARSLDLRYFVAGALARVILLEYVHGQSPGPATRDVDFGVFRSERLQRRHTGRILGVPDDRLWS